MPKPPPFLHERPSTIRDALDQAVLALRSQRFDEAERLAAGVLSSNRGHVLAAQLLGQALLQQGRAQDALDPLRGAARRSRDPAI